MMRLINTAMVYMALGLFSGVFYREYTKLTDTIGVDSQITTLHTHLLSLGMMMFLLVAALDGVLHLSGRRTFEIFYWVYNAGLILTVVMMVVRGLLTLNGQDHASTSAAIPGIAGLGHIIITAGLVFLFVALREGVKERQQKAPASIDAA